MKVECQQCFTDVIPMGGGLCPACGERIASGQQTVFTKVTVSECDPIGSVCMKCGTLTNQAVRLRRKARNANYDSNQTSSLESHPLAVVINFFAGKFNQSVEVRLPPCGACGRNGVSEPKHIDFVGRSMTFVGHRAWKDDVERQRRAKNNA